MGTKTKTADTVIIWIIWVLLLVGLPWLFSESWNYPFRTEVTVYNAFCPDDKRAENTACPKGEEPANPTTYKTVVDNQTVLWWGSDGSPKAMKACAVRDAFNWSCDLSGNQTALGEKKFVVQMVDGHFSDLTDTPGMRPIFYQVPKYRWYWLTFKSWGK